MPENPTLGHFLLKEYIINSDTTAPAIQHLNANSNSLPEATLSRYVSQYLLLVLKSNGNHCNSCYENKQKDYTQFTIDVTGRHILYSSGST